MLRSEEGQNATEQKSIQWISSVTTSFTAVLPIVIMTINKDIFEGPPTRVFAPFLYARFRPGHDLLQRMRRVSYHTLLNKCSL